MFGRFFAFEMGCPEEATYLTLDDMQAQEEPPEQSPEGVTMICECRGLGCNKCKKKKVKIITLTGRQGVPIPVMNLPLAPFQPSMIMMGKPGMF
jgi:hypothetical protein